MKNKILIAVAILLILLVIWVRYEFKEKFEVLRHRFHSMNLHNWKFQKGKGKPCCFSFKRRQENISTLYTAVWRKQINFWKRYIIFFLYLSESVKYKVASLKYIDCLNSKCLIDEQNEANQKLITSKETELAKFRWDIFALVSKLKDEKLLKKVNKSGECSSFFPDLNEISFDANVWNDFEKFMIAYNSETRESLIQNNQTENQYASNVASTKAN